MFTAPTALRGLAAAAAATAILGAVVMRRWDVQAGKQVADLARSRAGDEWRYEERVAELESDLDESRELRVKLEQRLRSKRAELAALRNEHAALLRRYATAETERASALEGRRLLEIEAAPSPALPAARVAQDAEPTGAVIARDAVDAEDVVAARDAEDAEGAEGTDAVEAEVAVEADESGDSAEPFESAESAESAESVDAAEDADEAGEGAKASTVFSPEGSKLFLRAQAALARFDTDGGKASKAGDHADEEATQATSADVGATVAGGESEAAQEDEAQGKPEAVDEHARATAPTLAVQADAIPQDRPPLPRTEAPAFTEPDDADGYATEAAVGNEHADDTETARPTPSPALDSAPALAPAVASAPVAVGTGALVPRPAAAVQRRPSGHFAVPTAVAVVPAAQPIRRPTAEGGFDFFGTKGASMPHALEAVQNEDLADVVGQEALALHKAESEAEFKPVDEAARGVGQVIDLTAHDETEQIDLQSLRSAVS
ncbi:hypothetical protein [Streptomyces sp. NPDC005859]|uniref:hypothetical protein n=1 Tax=Streptomyces sp. NPDC005859 TaxID=3157170 RepID=UPI00340FE167